MPSPSTTHITGCSSNGNCPDSSSPYDPTSHTTVTTVLKNIAGSSRPEVPIDVRYACTRSVSARRNGSGVGKRMVELDTGTLAAQTSRSTAAKREQEEWRLARSGDVSACGAGDRSKQQMTGSGGSERK